MADIQKKLTITVSVILIIVVSSQSIFAESGPTITVNWNHIAIGFYLWSYKIITLFIGYLVAKLGYNLLIKGITGEFKFSAELKGTKADLASASPGIFFILMAAVIISIGLYKGLELSNFLIFG